MTRLLRLILPCVIIMGMAASVTAGEYSSAWQEYLAGHSQDRTVGGIITMSDQVDLRALQDHLYAIHADRQLWHETVVRALQEKATTTQADILSELADLESQGRVSNYHGLWVGNVIIVNATPDVFDLLMSRDDVERVSPDYPIEEIAPVGGHLDDGHAIAGVENGLRAIGADSCWRMGITGAGRLVSHLDTGVDGNHVALASRWRGVADSRYAGHPGWAWNDPETGSSFPFDSGYHGTHTMGTMCGRSSTGDTIGVAPDAQWISAGVIDRIDIPHTVDDALTAFEWTADPDGNPSTVWDVPDVSSNSWGLVDGHGYPPCDETFWTVLDGLEATGVVVNFAAGNEGSWPQTIRRPADRATTATKSFSVGAVDGNQYPTCPIAGFSSRGPSYCTPNGVEAVKPEVSAPGVSVRSSEPYNSYGYLDGTSMATPHVSGAVALIRQANPNLSSEQVHQILMQTAVDKGTPGEDNDYGAGVINVYRAVLLAQSMALSRCCYGNPSSPSCTDNSIDECNGLGGTWTAGITCESNPCPVNYTPGDANGNGAFNSVDIIYMVNYLKGTGPAPPVHINCPPHGMIYAAADANGDCHSNGIDITFIVNFLKGSGLEPRSCPDCPPAG